MSELKKHVLERGSKSKIEIIVQDLSAPGAAKKVFDACESKKLRISTLINNAGRAIGGYFDNHSLGELQSFMALNMSSLTEMTSLFLPQLIEFARANPNSDEGGLLNVSSSSAFQPIPYMTTYSASKAFVLYLTEGIHQEMKTVCRELRVTCLCPGPVMTSIWENSGGDASKIKLGWMPVEKVVADALQALHQKKAYIVPGELFRYDCARPQLTGNSPGWVPWIMSLTPRFGPRGITAYFAGRFMGQQEMAAHQRENKKAN